MSTKKKKKKKFSNDGWIKNEGIIEPMEVHILHRFRLKIFKLFVTCSFGFLQTSLSTAIMFEILWTKDFHQIHPCKYLTLCFFPVLPFVWYLHKNNWNFLHTAVEPPDDGSFSIVKDKRGKGDILLQIKAETFRINKKCTLPYVKHYTVCF